MTSPLRHPWIVAWAMACAALGVMAFWMLRQPMALPSDDALFFSRGLERFSVLEFSPHFPGYPGFIALGRLARLVAADPVAALFYTSTLAALALPPACAWTVWRWTGNHAATLSAFATVLTQPLLPALGLELLSDSTGLLFFILYFGAAADRHWKTAGLLLALAACCRPSYGPMILAALAVPLWTQPRRAIPMLAVFSLICAFAFGFVLAWEGWAYVDEALRFMAGHTTQWGNTAFSQSGGLSGWMQTITANPWLALPVLAALPALRRQPIAATAFMAALGWTALMQNPDNLRHAAPVILLGSLLACLWRPWAGGAITLGNAAALLTLTTWSPAPPPLEAALQSLRAQPPGTVITNYGVALARRDLPMHRVVDAAYAADATYAETHAEGPVWRLHAAQSGGRFAGERGLVLSAVTR